MACSLYLLVKFGLFSYKKIFRYGHDELSVNTWKIQKNKKYIYINNNNKNRKKEEGKHLPFSRQLTHFEQPKRSPDFFLTTSGSLFGYRVKKFPFLSSRFFHHFPKQRACSQGQKTVHRQKTVVRRWTFRILRIQLSQLIIILGVDCNKKVELTIFDEIHQTVGLG